MERRIQFIDAKQEYEPCSDCSTGDQTLSGESTEESGLDRELSGETGSIMPGQDNLLGKSMPGRLRDKILSGEPRNMKNKPEGDCVDSISTSDGSKYQTWGNVSETTPNSDASEVVFLLEWKQRVLDREMHQDAYRDRYSSGEKGTILDHAANDLDLIAVSKRPTRLLPHATVVCTNFKPLKQEAATLKKFWCVNLMDGDQAPKIFRGQLNAIKTYLKARYRLSDLLRAQRNDYFKLKIAK